MQPEVEYLAIIEKIDKILKIQGATQAKLSALLQKPWRNLASVIQNISQTNKEKADELSAKHSEIIGRVTTILRNEKEIIVSIIKTYFTKEFRCSEECITISAKKGGDQRGMIVKISQGESIIAYFVKTHHNGSKESPSSGTSSFASVDVKEIFVYKLLERLGIGAEIEFVVSAERERSLYIISRDCSADGLFLLFSSLREKSSSDFGEFLKAFNICDIITRILLITDTTTNSGNFGFLIKKGQIIPKIIDFRPIEAYNYKNQEIVESFQKINGAMRYGTNHELASIARTEDKINRLKTTRENLKSFCSNFVNIVNSIYNETTDFIKRHEEHLGLKEYEEDLKSYAKGIIFNYDTFIGE